MPHDEYVDAEISSILNMSDDEVKENPHCCEECGTLNNVFLSDQGFYLCFDCDELTIMSL